MDWPTILQVLRDVLTVVGASKLVYEGYRQIKKTFHFQRTGKNFQNTGKQVFNQLYKKVFGVRYREQNVRHSLQKKSNADGIPIKKDGIPFSKKVLVDKILAANDRILFQKTLTA